MSNAALLYQFLKPSTKAFIRKKSDAERRREDMESGALEQRIGSQLRGSWAGKGANLGGWDSAFICITKMHCAQYIQFIISVYHRFLLNVVLEE